jgi:hypothetical protein
MRTTMDLPKDLLEEAQKLCGAKTKPSTVILSLQKFIEVKKIEHLRSLRGKLDLNVDLKRLRRDRTAIPVHEMKTGTVTRLSTGARPGSTSWTS